MFNCLELNKVSVCFTWDDNFQEHYTIGSLFDEYHISCSFYINPGEKDFDCKYSEFYKKLSRQNFEIASHGFSHVDMTQLSEENYKQQLLRSILSIYNICRKRPLTFAFPHHNCSEEYLRIAKEYFLETRNTLRNSFRFSLKSHTSTSDMIDALNQAIRKKNNLIFSGHSIATNKSFNEPEGYEPVNFEVLKEFLSKEYFNDEIEFLTFEQAAFKELIISNTQIEGNS